VLISVLSVTTELVSNLVTLVKLVSQVSNVVSNPLVSTASALHSNLNQLATPKNSTTFATHSIKSAPVPTSNPTVLVPQIKPTQSMLAVLNSSISKLALPPSATTPHTLLEMVALAILNADLK
jgi:hypothetical protein